MRKLACATPFLVFALALPSGCGDDSEPSGPQVEPKPIAGISTVPGRQHTLEVSIDSGVCQGQQDPIIETIEVAEQGKQLIVTAFVREYPEPENCAGIGLGLSAKVHTNTPVDRIEAAFDGSVSPPEPIRIGHREGANH